MSQFFYDGQIRRYLTQVIRLFSNFYWKDGDGDLRQIPVMYGDLTRQVAQIIKENSENKLPSAPRMAVYITGLEIDRNRTGDSSFISKVHIRERAYNAQGEEYLNEQGKNYTVERLMPTPFILRLNVDVWSSNTDQKLQILEQIVTLFNPTLEIQTTDNFIDWTSLTVLNLETIQFSNRSIPIGTESEIDIGTMSFTTPIYLSPPAKVKRLGVITNIITSIYNEASGEIDLGNATPVLNAYGDELHPIEKITSTTDSAEVDIESKLQTDMTLNNRVTWTTTYKDYGIYVLGSVIQLVDKTRVGTVNWRIILESYPGTYKANISQIRMRQFDSNNFIVGTFALNPLNETEISVNWDTDTLPSNDVIAGPARNPNSYTSIDYIIEPQRWNPTNEKTPGLRVLILSPINNSTSLGDSSYSGPNAWKNSNGSDFAADENDIVEWDGSSWHVVFDASQIDDVTYIKNLNTNIQYKWTGTEWIKSWEGFYSGGNWMVYLDG